MISLDFLSYVQNVSPSMGTVWQLQAWLWEMVFLRFQIPIRIKKPHLQVCGGDLSYSFKVFGCPM